MSDDTASMVIDDTRERMTRAVERTRNEFTTIRTGRAAPALVDPRPNMSKMLSRSSTGTPGPLSRTVRTLAPSTVPPSIRTRAPWRSP